MRVNIYAEEITDRVHIIRKTTEAGSFVGLRFYLELPISTLAAGGYHTSHRGPFIRQSGDDDSSAVTFWASDHAGLRKLLAAASTQLIRSDSQSQGGASGNKMQTPGQYEGNIGGIPGSQCRHGYDRKTCPVNAYKDQPCSL